MASKERIILDTNYWISFLITKNFSKLDPILIDKKAVLLFSQELLDEFIDVSQRPKLRKYFSIADITELLQTIDNYSELVKVTSKISICRDSKDNFLLELAKDGNADYLISGDKDLLDIKTFGNTKIISISEYLSGKVI